jgi:hypothetical protein
MNLWPGPRLLKGVTEGGAVCQLVTASSHFLTVDSSSSILLRSSSGKGTLVPFR